MTNDEVFRHSCFGILSPFVICASSFSSLIQECEHEIAFGNDSVIHHTAAMRFRKPIAARFDQFRVNEKRVAWKNWFAKLHFISALKLPEAAQTFRQLNNQNVGHLGLCFAWGTPGITGWPGKWPAKYGSFTVTVFRPVHFVSPSKPRMRSTIRNGKRCGRISIT